MIFIATAAAQETIYRCGNTYTNTPPAGERKDCKPLDVGNLTVVPGPRSVMPTVRPAAAAQPTPRVEGSDQRARDLDARMILDSELRKAEARREELLREYNNGSPEKLGPETRNHQKYLDRVAEIKAGIERTESDIAGLRRELSRIPGSK